MRTAALFALLAGSASAFAPSSQSNLQRTSLDSSKADLEEFASKLNPVVNYYDPLHLADWNLFEDDTDGSQAIGWLRHAEIKHGRVAMAAFVGYCLQANGLHWPWPTSLDGTLFPSEGLSPPEQWDALSNAAKYQIIIFVGFLEHFSESTGTHYMKGGIPGKFENFNDHPEYGIPHPVPLGLYDPFGFTNKVSKEKKEAGLVVEVNNGRLAMIGIMGVLAAQTTEGSVPLLKGILPHYDGQVMSPF